MTLIVRLRPNAAYLALLAIGLAVITIGAVVGAAVGVVLIACGAVLAVVLGFPVIASTVFRVPVIAVGPDGIRMPLMGVRLGWDEITGVRPGVRMRGQHQTPVLLVMPRDPEAVVGQARFWLRRQARDDVARFGTPVVIDDRSLDHTLEEIRLATAQR